MGKQHNVDDLKNQTLSEHPSIKVLTLARDCDSIISDDRFFNQHATIDDGSAKAPIFSTLDLIDLLASVGSITLEDQLEYRTQLRRAGYFFVPVSEGELATHLAASTIEDDKIFETAELKAIRENILCVRMSNWLQPPREAPWLSKILNVFLQVLKSLWRDGADLSSVRVRSNWLLDQLDIRGWAHSLGTENRDNVVKTGRGVHLLMILTPPLDAPQDIKDAYWSWVEDSVLVPIKEQWPDLYEWLVEWHRKHIANIADMELAKGERHDE